MSDWRAHIESLKKPLTDEKLAELDDWYSKCSSNSLKFCDADYLAMRERLRVAEVERDAARAERDRLACDALILLAGSNVITPAEGFVRAPHCLARCIKDLRDQRDAALAEAAKANSANSSADLITASVAGNRFANEVQAIKAERDAALTERDHLIAALEFYASPDPWTQNALEGNYGDYGNKAREALAAVPPRDGEGTPCEHRRYTASQNGKVRLCDRCGVTFLVNDVKGEQDDG